PLAAQASTVRTSRRIGLGLTGLADALVMLGARYGSPASLALGRRILRTIRDAAYGSSIALAREKGAFPAFESEPYLESEFVRRLPVRLRQLIADHGIRNSHLLAIAPTGSISLLAGGVSTGIEPIFAGLQLRTVRTAGGGSRTIRTLDPALAHWRGRGEAGDPPGFVTARELPVEAHLAMQAALQPFVDNAISKTVNVAADLSFEAFRSLFERAYALGLKGCTAFRATRQAVIREGEGPCVAP
ncbi:MAG: ribonucleoside-diphosphate reductase, adenosylcobalamin-dependent, partial [Alphaproteobacteria bacterium]|nr:ribonucleoside-diphosphate reductase, adenosylcobalamin-dependent [Alphaproteobacteria bacterium]